LIAEFKPVESLEPYFAIIFGKNSFIRTITTITARTIWSSPPPELAEGVNWVADSPLVPSIPF
jgi:hypothetical protein